MSQRFSKKVSDALLAKLRAGEKLTGGEKLNLIVQLSIPSILAQVTTVLMFYIDASMVGSLGAEASASIGLVEPATWLFGSLVGSVSMGFSVQAAHFIGANDFTRARAVMRHGYAFGLLIGLLLMAIAALIAFPLPRWLGGGADIQHGASMYFLIFSFAVPVHLIEHLSASMLKVSGDVRRPSAIAVLMCCFDVIFNFFFIFPTRTLSVFGHEMTVWGLGLGVEGAALGTLMAFVAAAIPLFYFAVFRSKILAWRQDVERFTWCWDYIRHACGLGAPMAFQYLLMNGAQVVSTTIVAPLGNIAIAALRHWRRCHDPYRTKRGGTACRPLPVFCQDDRHHWHDRHGADGRGDVCLCPRDDWSALACGRDSHTGHRGAAYRSLRRTILCSRHRLL